jgi:protocadherin Fat 4
MIKDEEGQMEKSTGRSTAPWLSLFLIAVLVGQGWADCNYLINELYGQLIVQENVTVGHVLANFSATSLTINKANEQKYINLLRVAEQPPGWWIIEVNGTLDAEWEKKPVDTSCDIPEPIEKPTINFQCIDASDPDPGDYTVTLIIEDVNEYAPVFNEPDSTIEINESEAVGSLVYTVTAKDPDYEALTLFEYAIVDGSDGYFILLDLFKGQIFLNQSLDYEAGRKSFVLNISATEYPTSFGKTNYTTLTLIVRDVDDLPPKFSKPLYRISIPEGNYTGDTWNKLTPEISAWDQDSQLNTTIQFKIGPASFAQYSTLFLVNKTNGLIGINGNLSAGVYEILILAYQIDKPELRYDTALVIITATNVNKPPRMKEDQYNVSVSENASPQTILLVVSAIDDDGDQNSGLIFQLDNTAREMFTVENDQHTGIIRLNHSLDWETRQNYTFEVWAEETSSTVPYRSKNSTVTITVLDENDNSPEFHQTFYTFNINKTHTQGDEVGQVSATDADDGANKQLTYEFQFPTTDFAINKDTGIITLNKNFTVSKVGSYNLVVNATDGTVNDTDRRKAFASVTVNILPVNTSPPTFVNAPYSFTVSETAAPGCLVGYVSATDVDGDSIQYTLSDDDYFSVDQTSGAITVAKELDMDANVSPQLFLTINAADGLHNVSANITVDFLYVNEFQPKFGPVPGPISIPQNASADTLITQVTAYDEDKGQDGILTYTLITTRTSPFFKINSSTGEITLNCSMCLDPKSYFIFVEVTDGGIHNFTDKLSVQLDVIKTEFDNPHFSEHTYHVSLQENGQPQVLLQLPATDCNTPRLDLHFSSTAQTPSNSLFEVFDNGTVYINNSVDAENQTHFVIEVSVTNGHHVDNATIEVNITDVNDNPPILNITLAEPLYENSKTGVVVAYVNATDEDKTNGGFSYFLTDGADGKFKINVKTGVITLNELLDRQQKPSYNITVSVLDHGAPPALVSGNLIVEVIDSNTAPYFVDAQGQNVSHYYFNVTENFPIATSFNSLYAVDPDIGSSGKFHFTFKPPGSNVFSLDEFSGNLSLVRALNYEETTQYNLTVLVTDKSYEPKSSSITVTIEVINVEKPPQWPQHLPTVYITQSPFCQHNQQQLHSFPQEVPAASSPVKIEYSLLNLTDIFSIDRFTGILNINISISNDSYTLGISACNSGTQICSNATLTVVLKEEDVLTFCPAFYKVEVNESTNVSLVLLDLDTTKPGSTVIYNISDGNIDGKFKIGHDGKLSIAQRLDREKTQNYVLLVTAEDTSTNEEAEAQIVVIVTDAPDTPPEFPQTSYAGHISENEPLNSQVLIQFTNSPLIINATDKDENPKLDYSVDEQNDTSNGSFYISNKNEILLAKIIDYETISEPTKSFTFKVLVADGYYTATATVAVYIDDVNDNPPHFVDPEDLSLNVTEGPTSIQELANITVTDIDTKTRPIFSLSPPGAAAFFHIDRSTGTLSVVRELDREVSDNYILNVTVTDEKATISKLVTVTVLDINDNSPQFKEAFYLNVTEGDAGLGTNITVVAYDDDTPPNAQLTYSIVSGDDGHYFEFVGNVLKTVAELDREKTDEITLIIQAADSGTPSRTATGTVIVRVININDNSPKFSEGTYYASLPQDAINVSVALSPPFYVTDADKMGCPGFRYELLDSSTPFTINETTGMLYVSREIDKKPKDTYSFQVFAIDDCGHGLNSSAQIIIHVTGASETVPRFSQPIYYFEILKNSTLYQHVGTVNTTDNNNGIFHYELNEYYMFYINPLKGEIQLIGDLEDEDAAVYVLNASVCNAKNQCDFAVIYINVTDTRYRCPSWNTTSLYLSLKDKQASGPVGSIAVLNNDGSKSSDTEYFLNDTNHLNYIEINKTGEVTLLTPLSADKSNTSSFNFLVYTEDIGHPDCHLNGALVITVEGANDNNPEICFKSRCGETLIEFSVYDESPKDTPVALVSAYDMDTGRDGEVTLHLTSQAGGPQDLFFVGNETGIISLLKKINITDIKNIQNHTVILLLVATDNGEEPHSTNATIRVKVIKKTLNTQTFSKAIFNMTVREKESSGTYVGTVSTTPNESFNYSISTSAGNLPFEINPDNGNITTTESLDRDTRGLYIFNVQAFGPHQQKIPIDGIVMVTVEDVNEPPYFDQTTLTVTVVEEETMSELLTLKAHDNDEGNNGHLTYSLLNALSYTSFKLNKTTGVLSVETSLDRETNSNFDLTIQAMDGGSPPLNATQVVHVIVADINDNSPKFSSPSYECNFTTSQRPVKACVVTATDADEGVNGSITYHLESETQTFEIGSLSGEIRTIVVPVVGSYDLEVTAYDKGRPSLSNTTHVYVRVIDNRTTPTLSLSTSSLQLFLGMPARTQLHVNITTKNANHLEILGVNVADTFELRSEKLYLKKSLDKKSDYNLNITATSSTGESVSQELTIQVDSPKFEQQIYSAAVLENYAVPQVLLDLNSSAELSGIPVIYSLQNDFDSTFEITRSTGVLSLVKSLDRDVSPVYKLNVILTIDKSAAAITGRRKRSVDPDQAIVTVVITVDDENDNVPSFDNLGPEVSLSIPESVNASYLVTTFKASDPDEGLNGLIRYSISNGDSHVFNLDPVSGELSVVSPELLKGHLTFTLTIQATDRNGTGNSTSINIKISIIQNEVTQSDYVFKLSTPMDISKLQDNLQAILSALSSILGYRLSFEKITTHEEAGTIYSGRSDIWFRAFLLTNGNAITNLTNSQIADKVAEHQEEINKLFQSFIAPAQKQDGEALDIVSKSLIGLTCFLFVVTLLAVILLCRMWRKNKRNGEKNKNGPKEEFRLEEQRTVEHVKRTNIYSEADENKEAATTLSEVPTSARAGALNTQEENIQQHLQHVQHSLEPLESESMDTGTASTSNSNSRQSGQKRSVYVNSGHQNGRMENQSSIENNAAGKGDIVGGMLDNKDGSNENLPDPDYKVDGEKDGGYENLPDPDYKADGEEDRSNENLPEPDYKTDGSNENLPDPDYSYKAGGDEDAESPGLAENSKLEQISIPAPLTIPHNPVSHSPSSQSSTRSNTSTSSYSNGVLPHKSSNSLVQNKHQHSENNINNNYDVPELKSSKTVAFTLLDETIQPSNEEDIDQHSITEAVTHF